MIPLPPPEAPPLNGLFVDHVVLQRDQPIKVWGHVGPGESVAVTLANTAGGPTAASGTATADDTGHWNATLSSLPAGGPYELNVKFSGGKSEVVHDVLIGDVFLCSGQSNMQLQVSRTLNSHTEITEAHNDSIRMLTVPMTTSFVPQEAFSGPLRWLPTTPENVGDFSAACYYFARELQKTVQVPVGLINSSWGGTSIQPWMSESALHKIGGYEPKLQVLHEYAADVQTGGQHWGKVWETWWQERMHSQPWQPAIPDEKQWRVAPTPLVYWEKWGVPELAHFDGTVWYRTSVNLTAKQASQQATLGLGTIDQIDTTWLNGHYVGATSGADKDRTYPIPTGTLHKGVNVVAINVLDTYSWGGINGPAEKRAIHFADGSDVPLDKEWKYQIVASAALGPPLRAPWDQVAGVTIIRNAMITPIGPFQLRGALWYQGESNAEDASHYQALLTGMMTDWRRQFGGGLSFLVVQLANYGAAVSAPAASNWAELREAERLAVGQDRHAALAVAIDIGERNDIHPANKQDLGKRLARAARHVVYGENLSASGPVPLGASWDQGHVVVNFKDVDGGLLTYGTNRPIGFELCGADQASCQYAEGTVQGNSVVLEPAPAVAKDGHAAVPGGEAGAGGSAGANVGAIPGVAGKPTRVRFGWADSPVCNLYDRAGLPAGPFEVAIK